jgi:hypothetical protein
LKTCDATSFFFLLQINISSLLETTMDALETATDGGCEEKAVGASLEVNFGALLETSVCVLEAATDGG